MMYHAESPGAALGALNSQEAGLSSPEAEKRLQDHGPNQLPAQAARSPLIRFFLHFNNPLIYVLLGAAFIAFMLNDYVDTAVILGVVLINAIIGFVQEGKAERALDAVRAMLPSQATVLRDGQRQEIDAVNLVPGDIVMLESGAKVPADLRLLNAKNLRINEAALTGESVPVDKDIAPVAQSAPVGDRHCMAFSGTGVTSGHALGLVIATGAETEIGRIGAMVAGVQNLATPLTRRLDQFGRQITVFILFLGGLTFLYGRYLGGMETLDIFLAVVGLAVAAIPEGLPAIVTITLAIGTSKMARHKAIVRALPAVETLGSVSVICSDKTGTLTKNEMTAVRLMLPDRTLQVTGAGYAPEGDFLNVGDPIDPRADESLQRLARCALLCNDAGLHHEDEAGWVLSGDPTDGALLALAQKAGLELTPEASRTPRIDEIPFESENRFMATLHRDQQGNVFAYLKGASEQVLSLCVQDSLGQTVDQDKWTARLDEAASQGQRVLALAVCELPQDTASLSMDDITPRFTLLGMAGLMDPPRPEAIKAVAECQNAGIRVVMITGDHAVTAAAIGHTLALQTNNPLTGPSLDELDEEALRKRLGETDVIARASPEHKLRLVGALQAEGRLVAMTGDGVNDAPALKAADIGVAMGHRGTDAAREASELVLTDDNFSTIEHAVREGRVVFDNIKKSVLFILPTNGGQAGVILLAVFAGLAIPITASQILWVNMVTAVTLAIALAFEPGEAGVMRRPPRSPSEPLITRLLLGRIIYVSFLMIVVAYAAYEWELIRGSSLETARTAVVNMLVFGEIVYLFNMRHFTQHSMSKDIVYGNPVAFWAASGLIAMQLLFTYAPPLQQLFHTEPLGLASWIFILVLGTAKFFAVEAEKWVLRRFGVERM